MTQYVHAVSFSLMVFIFIFNYLFFSLIRCVVTKNKQSSHSTDYFYEQITAVRKLVSNFMVFILIGLQMLLYLGSANYFECPKFLDRFSGSVMSHSKIEWFQMTLLCCVNLLGGLGLYKLKKCLFYQQKSGLCVCYYKVTV